MHEYSLASEIADIVVNVGKENHIKKITQINIGGHYPSQLI